MHAPALEPTAPALRQRYEAMFRFMIIIAVLSYGSYLGLFVVLGVPTLPLVNLVATALCLLSYWMLRRGWLPAAFALMGVVVVGHTAPATAVLGWNANFHLFAFLYLVFALLNPELRLAAKLSLCVGITAGYLALETLPHEVSSIPAATAALFKVLNTVMFAGTISLLALIYSSAIWSVTSRLNGLIGAERQARDNLKQVFADAPVALVLSRLEDGILRDANQRAVALFEVTLADAVGRPAPDFWVNPDDRQRLNDLVAQHGRADGFEAELRTNSGRRFWAELSASVVNVDNAPSLLVGCTDITLRRRADEALRRSENQLRTLLDAAPTPLVVTRMADSVLQFGNAPAAEMFEVPVEDLVGTKAPNFYANPEDRQAFVDTLRRDGRVDNFSARLRTRQGRDFWALLSARLFDLEGQRTMIVGFADLSAQKALEDRLRNLAITDGLTGAFNRRHFLEVAEAELTRAQRSGRPTSVAILDVDHFKAINDGFGHEAGDAVLTGLGKLLHESLRGADVVGRVGGEEFALLLPETDPAAATATLERLRRTVELHRFTMKGRDGSQPVTVSIGLAATLEGESLTDVLRRADAALYGAKSGGRNKVVVAAKE